MQASHLCFSWVADVELDALTWNMPVSFVTDVWVLVSVGNLGLFNIRPIGTRDGRCEVDYVEESY
jgi:hypothetical protein